MDNEKILLEYLNEKYYETIDKIHELLKEQKDLWNLVERVRLSGAIDAILDIQIFIESLK